jgi:hypothetical protein
MALPLAQKPTDKSSTGKFNGVVVDQRDRRIKSADVMVSGENITRQLKSDKVGEFGVELPAGRYEISVVKVGFKKLIVTNIEIKPGASEMFTFRLERRVTDGSDTIIDRS